MFESNVVELEVVSYLTLSVLLCTIYQLPLTMLLLLACSFCFHNNSKEFDTGGTGGTATTLPTCFEEPHCQ